jgi:hypothetical protein
LANETTIVYSGNVSLSVTPWTAGFPFPSFYGAGAGHDYSEPIQFGNSLEFWMYGQNLPDVFYVQITEADGDFLIANASEDFSGWQHLCFSRSNFTGDVYYPIEAPFFD